MFSSSNEVQDFRTVILFAVDRTRNVNDGNEMPSLKRSYHGLSRIFAKFWISDLILEFVEQWKSIKTID